MRFAAAWPLFLLLLLEACSSVGPSVRAAVASQTFTLNGRISVQHGEENFSGSLDWVANDKSDELLFSSPLGQGIASLTRSAGGVVLTPAGREAIRAETADDLTEKTLGFRLPLGGLRYWIQGHPDPGSPFESSVSENGGIARLKQSGWVIDYLQYRESRPRKIHVSREGLEIRLVIDQWQAN